MASLEMDARCGDGLGGSRGRCAYSRAGGAFLYEGASSMQVGLGVRKLPLKAHCIEESVCERVREAVGVARLFYRRTVKGVSGLAAVGVVDVFGGVCGGAFAGVFGSARDRPELPAARDGMRRWPVSGIPTKRGHSNG